MEKEAIENDPIFKEYNREKGGRNNTKYIRMIRIQYYCDFLKMKPSTIIEEAEKEEDKGLRKRKRKINKYLFDYIDHLKKSNKSKNTIISYISTVKSFYRHYDIEIPRIQNIYPQNNINPSLDNVLSKQEIENILTNAGFREKATILLQLSSGMGSAEIRNLKYSDFTNSISKFIDEDTSLIDIKSIDRQLRKRKDLIGTWKISRVKTGMPYITFNSLESNFAILDYLLSLNQKKMIESLDQPLFPSRDSNKISREAFLRAYQRLNDKLGLGKEEDGHYYFRAHKLRKFFTTAMMKSHVDKMVIDWMLGHKINGTDAAYFKVDISHLKSQYMLGLKEVTIGKVEVKQVHSTEYADLIEINKKMENKLEERDSKIGKLEKKVAILEEMAIKLIDS